MTKKLNTQQFIQKAIQTHGQRYSYEKAEYVNSQEKVFIICHNHGEFVQTPNNHLRGQGCPVCSGNKRYTTEEFIEKAKTVHDNKYDYSKVVYRNSYTKVTIICSKHGEFPNDPVVICTGQVVHIVILLKEN